MRKRTKRKVWAKDNPITLAMSGAAIISDQQTNQLRSKELTAIEALARGQASEADIYDLFAMITICKSMAQGGIGPEALEACERAEQAIAEDMHRFTAIGKIGTTGPGLQAYRDVYQYHDLQRTSISTSEYAKYIRKAINQAMQVKPTQKTT